jgi:hypothetical protein
LLYALPGRNAINAGAVQTGRRTEDERPINIVVVLPWSARVDGSSSNLPAICLSSPFRRDQRFQLTRMPDPEKFLTVDGGKVSINSAGAWTTILSKEGLKSEDTSVLEVPANQTGNNLLLASSKFWGHEFSSERNVAYFVDPLDNAATLANNAWIGDDNGCQLFS